MMTIDGKPYTGYMFSSMPGSSFTEFYVDGEQATFERYILNRIGENTSHLRNIESLMWQILQEVQKQK